jgi:OOP family OmpA-OmpF porin
LQLFGINNKRLVTKGFGESKPIAANDSEEGRSQNRRVELIKIN